MIKQEAQTHFHPWANTPLDNLAQKTYKHVLPFPGLRPKIALYNLAGKSVFCLSQLSQKLTFPPTTLKPDIVPPSYVKTGHFTHMLVSPSGFYFMFILAENL